MTSDDLNPLHTDMVDREAHDGIANGVPEDECGKEREDDCANDSDQDVEEEFLAEPEDDDQDPESIQRAAEDGQSSEAGDKAKSPSLRTLTTPTVPSQAASSRQSQSRQLSKIFITIDCDEIPEATKVPSKPDTDTVHLADNYTDEDILLGKVAHPHDLHGTIFLRLWESYSREELTQRINWLYEALKMNGVSPSAYSHRFDQALAAKAKREEWSKERQQEEKDRIKKKQPRGVRAEWIPAFINRPNIPTPPPKTKYTQTNPRQYGPMKKKGVPAGPPRRKQKGNASVSSGMSLISDSLPRLPSKPAAKDIAEHVSEQDYDATRVNIETHVTARKPTTNQRRKVPVSSGRELVSVSSSEPPSRLAAKSIAKHVSDQDRNASDISPEPHVAEKNSPMPKLTFKEMAKQPARKWTRKPFKFKSFTGSEWSMPSFAAAVQDQGQRSKVQLASSEKKSTPDDGEACTTRVDNAVPSHQSLAASSPRGVTTSLKMKEDEQEAVGDGVGDDRD